MTEYLRFAPAMNNRSIITQRRRSTEFMFDLQTAKLICNCIDKEIARLIREQDLRASKDLWDFRRQRAADIVNTKVTRALMAKLVSLRIVQREQVARSTTNNRRLWNDPLDSII